MYEILPLAKSQDFDFFLPGAVDFHEGRSSNRLRAFPLEASVPVLLYNKERAYAKAGVPDVAPATWHDLQGQLIALAGLRQGHEVQLHDERPVVDPHREPRRDCTDEAVATKNNGLDGPGATLTFNDLLHVRHGALMIRRGSRASCSCRRATARRATRASPPVNAAC